MSSTFPQKLTSLATSGPPLYAKVTVLVEYFNNGIAEMHQI